MRAQQKVWGALHGELVQVGIEVIVTAVLWATFAEKRYRAAPETPTYTSNRYAARFGVVMVIEPRPPPPATVASPDRT
jgi:hypothetical protein